VLDLGSVFPMMYRDVSLGFFPSLIPGVGLILSAIGFIEILMVITDYPLSADSMKM